MSSKLTKLDNSLLDIKDYVNRKQMLFLRM